MPDYPEKNNLLYRGGVFIIALILGLVIYGLAKWAWNSPAEQGAYDMLLRMRPAPVPRADLAILAIDNKATTEMGKLPWNRLTHAKIIRALRRAGAKFIVYDMMFAEPSTLSQDRALRSAMLAGNDVLLPMVYDPLRHQDWNPADIRGLINIERSVITERIIYPKETPFYRYYYFIPPYADFINAASGVGVAVNTTDWTGVVREAKLGYLTKVEYPVPSQQLPTGMAMPKLMDQTVVVQGLPLVVARREFDVEKQATQVDFTKNISLLADLNPYVNIPIDDAGGMKINYSGATGTYPTYSVADLMSGKLKPSVLKGKTVFVGITDPTSPYPAFLRTPYGVMPRVEITANSVGTILDRTYITRTPQEAVAVLLLLAVIAGLAFPGVRLRSMGAVALITALLYIVIAVLVLMVARHAWPVIPAVLLILLTATVAGLLSPSLFAERDYHTAPETTKG